MHLKAVELFEARSNVLFKRKPWSPSFNISYILVAILIWFAASYWLAARDYLSHSAVLIFLLISLILGVGVLSFSSWELNFLYPSSWNAGMQLVGGELEEEQSLWEHFVHFDMCLGKSQWQRMRLNKYLKPVAWNHSQQAF